MKALSEQGNASRLFQLQRLGVVMEPEPGNPMEAEGVSNPASARGRDGQFYLFPRLVARGNYSRIGIARMCFTRPVTRWESSGSVSRWSQKLITNYGPMEAVARIRASLSSSRWGGM